MSPDQSQSTDVIRAQIGISIGLARSLVNSWLPPETDSRRANVTSEPLTKRRAPNVGLGARATNEPQTLSLAEHKIDRKLNQKRKHLDSERHEREKTAQRKKKEESDDEEEVQKGSVKKKVQAHDVLMKKRPKGFGRT